MDKYRIQLNIMWTLIFGLLIFTIFIFINTERQLQPAPESPPSLVIWTPRTSDTARYQNAFLRLHDLFANSVGGWSRFEITGGWRDQTGRDIIEPGYFYLVNIEGLSSELTVLKTSIDAILKAPANHDNISLQGFEQQESFVQLLDMRAVD